MRLFPITLLTIIVAFHALSSKTAWTSPLTVKSCNRQVTFDRIPQRAVSNDVNLTEMMLVLGLQSHMAGYTGISGWKTQDNELRKSLRGLTDLSPKYPSKEVLVGANIDFFFAGWNYGMKVGGPVTPETLAPFGIKVYELTESCIHIMKKNRSSINDMYTDLLNLGKIFGVESRARKIINAYKTELSALKKTLPATSHPPRIFVYDSGEDQPLTACRYAIPTALIEEAGGHNIMADVDNSWTKVNWETVVERNPEIIIIINYGKVTAEQKRLFLMNRPAFAQINAIQNNRFVVLEYVEVTPGPRNIIAIKKLARAFWSK